MKAIKLTPYQIAIDMSNKEFMERVEQMLNHKFREGGFKITGIGEDKYNKKRTIILRKDYAKEKDVPK